MKRTILFIFAGTFAAMAVPNVQVITESDVALPAEVKPMPPDLRLVPPAPVPLVPIGTTVEMTPPMPVPLVSPQAVRLTPPALVPLVSPDTPHLTPSKTESLEQAATTTFSEDSSACAYRVLAMPLNDFGVAMARRAGLRYIYNPAVRGTVNGKFHSTDPIYMLRLAAKTLGYKLIIKDGIEARLEKDDG